jgi:hypothetical protein
MSDATATRHHLAVLKLFELREGGVSMLKLGLVLSRACIDQ